MNIKLVEETLSLINCRSIFFDNLFYNYLMESPGKGILLSEDFGEYKLRKTINYLFLIISNFRNPWLGKTLVSQMIEEKYIVLNFILEHELAIGESLCKTLKYFLQKRWTPEVKQAWMHIYNATLALLQQEQERHKDYLVQREQATLNRQHSQVKKGSVPLFKHFSLIEGEVLNQGNRQQDIDQTVPRSPLRVPSSATANENFSEATFCVEKLRVKALATKA